MNALRIRPPHALLRAWLRAARPLAHGNIAPALLLGEAMAWHDGASFDPARFAFVHLFGALDHLCIVFANDVADEATDRRNRTFTPFSGGSRVLVDGLLTPRALTRAARACALLLVLASLVFARTHRAWAAPLLACAALALLHAYSFPPLRLSYRGGGEWLQGLGIGLVLPLVGAHATAPARLPTTLPLLVGTVLLGAAGNVITALPDAPSDRASDKRTWAVLRGDARARRDAVLFVLCATTALACALPVPVWVRAACALLTALPCALTWRMLPRAEPGTRACTHVVILLAGAGALAQFAAIALLLT